MAPWPRGKESERLGCRFRGPLPHPRPCMIPCLYVFTLMSLLFCRYEAQAGPWQKSWGEAYGKVYTSAFFSNDGLAPSAEGGAGQSTGQYIGLSAGFYAEVGLPSAFSASVLLPYQIGMNRVGQSTYGNGGLGDLTLSLLYQIPPSPLPIALALDLKIPLYNNQRLLDETAPFPHPALGDGQVDITPRLSVGGSLWPRPFYAFADVGYRHRSEWGPGPVDSLIYLDAWIYLAHMGVATPKWRVNLFNQGVLTRQGGNANSRSQVSTGASIGRKLPGPWWISLDLETLHWAVAGATGTSIGLSLSRDDWHPR